MRYGPSSHLLPCSVHATTAVQTGAFGNALHHQIHLAIGIAFDVAKDEIVRPGVLALWSPQMFRKLRTNEKRLGSGFASGIDAVGTRPHAEPSCRYELLPESSQP